MKLFHFVKKHPKGVLRQIVAFFNFSLASAKLKDYLEKYLAETSLFTLTSESLINLLKYNSTSTQGDEFYGGKR